MMKGDGLSSFSLSHHHHHHLNELSRAYKSREWSTHPLQRRKRKRSGKIPPCDQLSCFEVRPTPSKGGVGTFATQDIPSGHLLVPYERPIVSVPAPNNPNSSHCCQACLTPLGNLRHQLGVSQDDDAVPFLGALAVAATTNDKDHQHTLEFTGQNDIVTCEWGCGSRWCSIVCYEMVDGNGRVEHGLLCCGPIDGPPLSKKKESSLGEPTTWNESSLFEQQHHFRDYALGVTDGTPQMLLLAGQVMSTILGAILRDRERSDDDTAAQKFEWDDKDLFWWKEYSHPLWWKIGNTEVATDEKPTTLNEHVQTVHDRREVCNTAHSLLKKAFRSSIPRLVTAKNSSSKNTDGSSDKDEMSLIVSVLDRLCTVQHLAEIMGMLQCNVMEVDFPSPRQQFFSHLEQVIEDDDDDDDADDNKHAKTGKIKEYGHGLKRWGEEYLSKQRAQRGLNSKQDVNNNDFDSDTSGKDDLLLENIHTPITGSGLFPILTLANHDCDPNASIEFLGESNKGSLVALRDIPCGQEICITYIPNGDFDCGDPSGARFCNFHPTRTWLHLNKGREGLWDDGISKTDENCSNDNEKEDTEEAEESSCGDEGAPWGHDDETDESEEEEHANESDENESSSKGGTKGEETMLELPEGALWNDRGTALLEYGFECRCPRCVHEQRGEDVHYCRET